MNTHLHFTVLFGIALFLFTTPVFAQDEEAALPPTVNTEESATQEPETRAGQEVEINEDNYRQFMELKDPTLQREIIPENAFKPGSGLQKLDKLPEESQKHLRNQLREIIVQGDPWQPGDEETEYPYTPSEAASHNPALEKQELEAWGELVDSYHDRESQIYENSSGSQAARGSEQGSSNSQESGKSSPGGSGQDGEGSEGQQAGQEGNPNQSETEGTYSVNGSGNPDAKSTAGVSQNAMEFLQGLGKGGSNTGEGNQGDSTEGDGPGGDSPIPTDAQSQAQAQSGQQGSSASGGQQNPDSDSNAQSTAGSSQNAMEFLQGMTGQGEAQNESGTGSSASGETQAESSEGDQATSQTEGQQDSQEQGQETGQADSQETTQEDGKGESQGETSAVGQNEGQSQDSQQTETEEKPDSADSPSNTLPASPAETEEESTAGAAQNALEYLTGESAQTGDDLGGGAETDQAEGTLTIQDLLNAQGVGGATAKPVDEKQTDETKPEKDSDG